MTEDREGCLSSPASLVMMRYIDSEIESGFRLASRCAFRRAGWITFNRDFVAKLLNFQPYNLD